MYRRRRRTLVCFARLGCYRDPSWPWWRQSLPAFTMLFLVPIYSFLSTMANLQSYRSRHAPVMVSCISALCFLARCHPPFIAPCSPVDIELILGDLSFCIITFVSRLDDGECLHPFQVPHLLESDGIRLAKFFFFYTSFTISPSNRSNTHAFKYSIFMYRLPARSLFATPPRARARLCSRALRILRTKGHR